MRGDDCDQICALVSALCPGRMDPSLVQACTQETQVVSAFKLSQRLKARDDTVY